MAISSYYHADHYGETRSEARRVGPIETGEDLIEWVDRVAGKGLGLAQTKP
jgi:hypothetical protein